MKKVLAILLASAMVVSVFGIDDTVAYADACESAACFHLIESDRFICQKVLRCKIGEILRGSEYPAAEKLLSQTYRFKKMREILVAHILSTAGL